MSKFNLDTQDLAKPLATIASYFINSSDTEVDDQFVEALREELNQLPDKEITDADLFKAFLEVVGKVIEATPTDKDDKAWNVLKPIAEMFILEGNWFTGMLARIAARREGRKARKQK